MFEASANEQHEVTAQLGLQARQAIEVLVAALDHIDRDRNRGLLEGFFENELYEACVTVLMRLVFLFCAEERKQLPYGEPFYDQHYAASTLSARLREVADRNGEEVLEHSFDAWGRLLALFRAVHGGVEHEAMRLPAYGGSLFDVDRFPFLEGRTRGQAIGEAEPLDISNRTVLHVLEALQFLQMKGGANGERERRRLSFAGLDVEQIGHVYEGLLDHTTYRAKAPMLGLIGKGGEEPELGLKEIEQRYGDDAESFAAWISEETGASVAKVEKLLTKSGDELEDDARWLAACGNDKKLLARVRPFSLLVRHTSFGDPMVMPAGTLYVSDSPERRSTGTHYTPQSLTEPIVRHALEALVYDGPCEGKPAAEWTLKSARALLSLKICDLAMGSGAFLVQACRYLADRLIEAWERAESSSSGQVVVTPEGDLGRGALTEQVIPRDPKERSIVARRIVADRCLFGVDKNPLAVEMAKLSLWLITMQRDRPFTFLDHALRCGDSLLGVHDLEQVRRFHLSPDRAADVRDLFDFRGRLGPAVTRAIAKRRELESFTVRDLHDAEAKAKLLRECEEGLREAYLVADALIAAARAAGPGNAAVEARSMQAWAARLGATLGAKDDREAKLRHLRSEVDTVLAGSGDARTWRPFHWLLEFPEAFAAGGFDAVVSNPPFQYGTIAASRLGEDYMALLQRHSPPWHGKADLVVGFVKRGVQVAPRGHVGLISTSSILRGETSESCLAPLKAAGCAARFAWSPRPWPGTAQVEFVAFCLTKDWNGRRLLDDMTVAEIDGQFRAGGTTSDALPNKLVKSSLCAMLGVKLSPQNRPIAATECKSLSPEARGVLIPVVGGDELYSYVHLYDEAPLVIDRRRLAVLSERKRASLVSELGIADEESLEHSRPANALWVEAAQNPLCFACGETSVHLAFRKVDLNRCLPKHKAVLFPARHWGVFGILQSSIHVEWAWKWGLRRKRDLVYSAKRCAATFPVPHLEQVMLERLSARSLAYHETRESLMLASDQGPTSLYNLFHDSSQRSAEIESLREVHAEIDRLLLTAYGWTDLNPQHGFFRQREGVRYTMEGSILREILDRLLAMNYERYAEEASQGLQGDTPEPDEDSDPPPTTEMRSAALKPTRRKPKDKKTLTLL
ncbi:MAG: restriction endonuclease [Deltaproteobacteria bacterium]|nr:restriction endonuclease [Deltaproteobacteria bacterium]